MMPNSSSTLARQRFRSSLAGLLALVCLAAAPFVAKADEIPLALAANASSNGGQVTITVPSAGCTYVLTLLRKAGDLAKISIYTSNFLGAQGDSLAVKVRVQGSKASADVTLKDEAVSGQLLLLDLVIPPLPHPDTYQGTIIITAPEKDAMVMKVTLQQPGIARPATLIVEPQTESIQVVQSFGLNGGTLLSLRPRGEAHLTLVLRDKSGQAPIEDYFAQVESIAKSPDGIFDINRNIAFELGANDVTNSFQPKQSNGVADPNAPPSRIAAGGHADVGVRLQNLSTGEYDTTIRFRAANSVDDDGQKLHLIIDVRAPVACALLALLVALAISFVGTKIIAFRKKSLELQQRIAGLNTAWLKSEEPGVPAVCARAMLSQCDELSRRFWLSGANVIEDRLTRVEALLEVLNEARQVTGAIPRMAQSPMVRTRAIAALRRVIAEMGGDCTDTKVIAATKKVIDGFADWTQADHIEAAYWADLKPFLEGLVVVVRMEAITPAEPHDTMKALLDKLTAALNTAPAGLEAKVAIEQSYAYLKILWERRRHDEFVELANMIKANGAYSDIFRFADDAAWKRIKGLGVEGKIKIRPPESDDAQAYAPIRFRLTTGDEELDSTVLFKHLLHFEWNIHLELARGWRSSKPRELKPTTRQPEVVQYSPSAGKMNPSVTISRGSDQIEVTGAELAISPSSDFKLLRGFETTEMLSFTVTAVAAVLSGLVTFYVKNPTFGSLPDYLAIALWGLSADQTKNALQNYFGISKS